MWPNCFKTILPASLWERIVINKMPWKLLWGIYKVVTELHIKKARKRLLRKIACDDRLHHLLDTKEFCGIKWPGRKV